MAALTDENAGLRAALDAATAEIAALRGQVADLLARNAALQAALDACRASGDPELQSRLAVAEAALQAANAALAQQTALVTNQMLALVADLRSVFGNPAFVLPGGTPFEQLQNVVNAITRLNRGRKEGLYVNLGGRP